MLWEESEKALWRRGIGIGIDRGWAAICFDLLRCFRPIAWDVQPDVLLPMLPTHASSFFRFARSLLSKFRRFLLQPGSDYLERDGT